MNLILNIAHQGNPSGCILGIMSQKAMFMVSILSAGASGGANVGKSIVDVFGKVNQSLSGAAKVEAAAKPRPLPAATTAPVVTAAMSPKAAPEPVTPPDLSALVIGMDRADMLKKVGKPSMTINGGDVETCWYRSGSDGVTVTLRDGKVATISGAESLSAKEPLAPVHDSLSHRRSAFGRRCGHQTP